MYFLTLLLVAFLTNGAQSAEILVINPMPSYSHFTIPFKLAKELAHRGHQVTCINSYPQKTKIPNYTDVSVGENIAMMEEEKKRLFEFGTMGILGSLTTLLDMMATVTNHTLYHRNVQKLIQSGKQFDVVIVEHFFNEALLGIGYQFKAPIILVSSQPSNAMNNFIFANPEPMSYVPGTGGTLTKHMNFWQRIQNLLMNSFFCSLIHFYHLPQQNKMFKSYMKEDIELDEVLYNTSLMFTNSHVSVSDAVPHVPNIIEIGGFHVTPKPLPAHLQTFLDGATEGVVLFSMGSNLRSDDLKPETRDGILKAFSKIKQKVLWKFETDLPGVSENVKIMPWVPQQDILGHPNIHAFITHGGLLSTIEAVYHGVPLIGIPVFGDQPHNVAQAVEDGYAVKITLEEVSEETLSWALNEILTNPKYRENVQQRSKLMHDRPLKPIDSAVFWVEHVIRHRGAPHLRSAGVDLRWYQREMIDVLAFLLFVFGTMLLLTYVALKKLYELVSSKKVVKSTKVKKNQ